MHSASILDPHVSLLLHRRAVLFGLVGGMMVWIVFDDAMFAPHGRWV